MPGTPLMALSRGVTTALAHTSAFAPVYLVVTETAGGAMSGYCVMGKTNIDNTPNSTKNIDITNDKTGRFMKFLNIINGVI